MHQDYIIFLHIFYNFLHNFCMVLAGPVQSVHVPEHLHHIYFPVQLLMPVPKRRAQVRGVYPGNSVNQFIGAADLAAGLLHRQLAELFMLIGMVPD